MKLTEDNYFSIAANKKYQSVSQIKSFIGCPAFEGCEERTLAELNGEYERPKTDALIFGSLVDCMLTEPEKLEDFYSEHPEMISSRGATKGQLKKEYQRAIQMVERVKRDNFFMRTLEGDKQTIMVGEIAGEPIKIKMDVYKEGKYITDLKTTESIRKCFYNQATKRRETFLQFYNYPLQAAIYTEIVRQNTGKSLPFFISAISKEPTTDYEVIQITQEDMDEQLEMVKPFIEHIGRLKRGEIKPCKCGVCKYCLERKQLTSPILWQEICGRTEEEEGEDNFDTQGND